MANVIRPVGLNRNTDIFEEAAQQDRERNRRTNEEYFNLTGQTVISYDHPDPLVSLNSYSDIATDGNSYDERNGLTNRLESVFTENSYYVENSPTELLEPRSSRSNNRRSRISIEDDIAAENNRKIKEELMLKEKIRKDIEEKKDNVKDPLSYLEI